MTKRGRSPDAPQGHEIPIELTHDPKCTPEYMRIFREQVRMFVSQVERRGHNINFSPAQQRHEGLMAAVKRMDSKALREMIELDLSASEEEWGPHAAGTVAFIYNRTGIEPIIPREKLRTLDLDSPSLVKDVLALSDGAHQDFGLSLITETPDGQKEERTFAEMDLTSLNAALASE